MGYLPATGLPNSTVAQSCTPFLMPELVSGQRCPSDTTLACPRGDGSLLSPQHSGPHMKGPYYLLRRQPFTPISLGTP